MSRPLPAMSELGGGPLRNLPPPIYEYLFTQHFSGEKNKAPTSVKLSEKALQALSLMLIDLRMKGGQPWIQNQSDALSAGLWLLLALYVHYNEDTAPRELKTLMLLEQMEGYAKAQDRQAQMVDTIVNVGSKMVARLQGDPDGEQELARYLQGMVERLASLDGYWHARAKRAMREDPTVYKALKRFGLEAAVED